MAPPPRSPKRYPSDVSDDEWAFVAPYLTLLAPDALQRKHDLRAVFSALRYLARTGAPWQYLPGDFPPWATVYQQARRWMAAGCFEALVHDVRLLLRVLHGRQPQPTAAILDARVLQSSPESGARAGYNGHKRRKGSKVHAAVEINVVDPIARKGYRFKGTAQVVSAGETFYRAVAFFRARGTRNPVRTTVLATVQRALPLVSPAYDLGQTEERVRARWRAYYEALE